jgi:hypothetical protein
MTSIGTSGLQPLNPADILQVEVRGIRGGSALDKPTFGDRMKMFMAKGLGFFGRIMSAVGPFFGPLGSLLGGTVGSTVYGLSQGAVARMQAKRVEQAAMDQQAAALDFASLPPTPGFGGLGGQSNIQVQPFAVGRENEINNVLTQKAASATQAISGMGGL